MTARVGMAISVVCTALVGCTAGGNSPTGIDQMKGRARQDIEIREQKYEDGTIRLRYEGYTDAEGRFLRHGFYTIFWEDGSRKTEIHYRDNVPHGKRASWHRNGQRWLEGEYVDGKEHGVWPTWTPDGTLVQQLEFDHGAWNGVHRRWHPNGQLATEDVWDHGTRTSSKKWDDAGNLISSIE